MHPIELRVPTFSPIHIFQQLCCSWKVQSQNVFKGERIRVDRILYLTTLFVESTVQSQNALKGKRIRVDWIGIVIISRGNQTPDEPQGSNA